MVFYRLNTSDVVYSDMYSLPVTDMIWLRKKKLRKVMNFDIARRLKDVIHEEIMEHSYRESRTCW